MRAQATSDTASDDVPTWQSKTPVSKAGTVIVWAVFILYAVFLVKLVLFSRTPGSTRSLNLVPFAGISDYLFGSSPTTRRFAIGNVLGNMVAFVPLGAFLPLLQRKTGLWANLRIAVGASVAIESVQGILGVGASDIDDVILNTLGALLGILCFTGLRMLLHSWGRVIVTVAAAALVAAPVLGYLLFAIRLRM